MPPFKTRSLFMAPMVDLSHVAYRELVRSFGGCDVFYSEMLNARIVPGENTRTSIYLRWTRVDDLVAPARGGDPEKMHLAARRLDGFRPFSVDVNMGCWLKKVTCHGWGVALMEDPDRARRVLSAVREAVSTLVSVKMRIGCSPDPEAMCDFASMLEDAGADFIVLHARTAADGLSRKARWEYIARLKERLRVPVVGNGGVTRAEDALEMFSSTGCDGVMVGRQAVIQPWIFRDIKALMEGSQPEPPPPLEDVILDLHRLLLEHFGEDVALKRFKTGVVWLSQNLTFGHHLTTLVGRQKTMEGAASVVRDAFLKGIS